MEELIISDVIDSAEIKLKEDAQYGYNSIEKFKGALIGVATAAWGSGATEGSSGGEGHIGFIGGRWVKFNTRKSERANLEDRDVVSAELYDKMKTCSSFARDIMLELASSMLQGKMNTNFIDLGGKLPSTAEQQAEVHQAIIRWSAEHKVNGGQFLKRETAADMVNFLCKQLKVLTGMDIKSEVWGAAKKFARATRRGEDTRALFQQTMAAENGVTDVKSKMIGGKTLVQHVIGVANEAAKNSLAGPDGVKKVPRRVTGFAFPGKSVQFVTGDFNPDDKLVKASYVDPFAWRETMFYDRLHRIHNSVSAMISEMISIFPDHGLKELFSYYKPEDARNSSKYAEAEFCRRLAKYAKNDVYGSGHAVAWCEKGLSAGRYQHILRKLRDHFRNISCQSGVIAAGNGENKADVQATARELCGRIALFLDEQISYVGMLTTNEYMYINEKGERKKAKMFDLTASDERWEKFLQPRFDVPLPETGMNQKFWDDDFRTNSTKGGAKVDLIAKVPGSIVEKAHVASEVGVNSNLALVLVNSSYRDAVKAITNECVAELREGRHSPEKTAEVRNKFIDRICCLRSREHDDESFDLQEGGGTCNGLQLKQRLLGKIFDEEIVTVLGFPKAPPVANAQNPVGANANAVERPTIKSYVVDEIGTNNNDTILEFAESGGKVWDAVKNFSQNKDYRFAFAYLIDRFSTQSVIVSVLSPRAKVNYVRVLEAMKDELEKFEYERYNADGLRDKLKACLSRGAEIDRIPDKTKEELEKYLAIVPRLYGTDTVLRVPLRMVDVQRPNNHYSIGRDPGRWSDLCERDPGNTSVSTISPRKLSEKIKSLCAGKDFTHAFAIAINVMTDAASEWIQVADETKQKYVCALRQLAKILEDADVEQVNAQGLYNQLHACLTNELSSGPVDAAVLKYLKPVVLLYGEQKTLPAAEPANNGAQVHQS